MVQRGLKTFTIRLGLKEVVVSFDRLKPAVPFPLAGLSPPLPGRAPVKLPTASTAAAPASVPAPAPAPLPVPVPIQAPAKSAFITRSGRVSRPSVRFQ